MSKRTQEPSFVIRAYCTKCGVLIQESNPFYKKELIKRWDVAVVSAPSVLKCTCKPNEQTNLDIEFKIYRKDLDKEFEPNFILNEKEPTQGN